MHHCQNPFLYLSLLSTFNVRLFLLSIVALMADIRWWKKKIEIPLCITQLVRSVMLIPHWDSDKDFLLNSHIDSHSFCLLKLRLHDSLPN